MKHYQSRRFLSSSDIVVFERRLQQLHSTAIRIPNIPATPAAGAIGVGGRKEAFSKLTATDSLFLLPYQATGGGEAIVDHSAEIKPDLKTSIQSAMTDLERGLDVDQQQGAAAAEAAAENGSAELEDGVKAESAGAAAAAAADSTVSDDGRSMCLSVCPARG